MTGYTAIGVRFSRLLAICKRNRNKFDDTDYKIVCEAHNWFYHHGNRGKFKKESQNAHIPQSR